MEEETKSIPELVESIANLAITRHDIINGAVKMKGSDAYFGRAKLDKVAEIMKERSAELNKKLMEMVEGVIKNNIVREKSRYRLFRDDKLICEALDIVSCQGTVDITFKYLLSVRYVNLSGNEEHSLFSRIEKVEA